jgi:hypothetical protein
MKAGQGTNKGVRKSVGQDGPRGPDHNGPEGELPHEAGGQPQKRGRKHSED